MGPNELDPEADVWVMSNFRGLAGVLGSGLSLIAASLAALVFVGVLLAFHGWPTDATTGALPPSVAVVSAPATPAPTQLVIGPRATRPGTRAAAANGHTSPAAGRLRRAPSTSAPFFSDASRPKGASTTLGRTGKKPPTPCGCVEVPATILPPQVAQILGQVQPQAGSVTQQVQKALGGATTSVGGTTAVGGAGKSTSGAGTSGVVKTLGG
jgi:hypothetical protein